MRRIIANTACIIVLLFAPFSIAEVQKAFVQTTSVVGDGLHLWYEIKVDPEDASRLIICGTKWDALANTPFGFVYFSTDTGRTWKIALEDRSSGWVTEHSCAVGRHHLAYFVSNAATQTDIGANPVIGTARLFLSTDSGEHWAEKTKIGWTDYSTSAVSKKSERLYTFFHAGLLTRDYGQETGNALGLLVYSPDGTRVAGPYFSSGPGGNPYTGIYPSNALALPSGAVIALYYATRQGSHGTEIEVGTVRADGSPEPRVSQTVIAHLQDDHSGSCLNIDSGAMTYDARRGRLIVVYQDGCDTTSRVMLTTSSDDGKTWTDSAPIAMPKNCSGRIYSPSLIAVSDGVLGLLWEDKPLSPRWLFSYLENEASLDPAIALSAGSDSVPISNDSLETMIAQPSHLGPHPNSSPDAVIGVDVRSMSNGLWRTDGMVATDGGILVVWSAGTSKGMRLYSAFIGVSSHGSHADPLQASELDDVTRNSLLVYGGEPNYAGQYYDEPSRTLTICSAIRNRAEHAMRSPIEIRLQSLHSSWGSVSVVNATNALRGRGATWDISGLLTGDRIPAGAKSNPFCMSFRFDTAPHPPTTTDVNLLSFTLKVFAKHEADGNASGEQVLPRN